MLAQLTAITSNPDCSLISISSVPRSSMLPLQQQHTDDYEQTENKRDNQSTEGTTIHAFVELLVDFLTEPFPHLYLLQKVVLFFVYVLYSQNFSYCLRPSC